MNSNTFKTVLWLAVFVVIVRLAGQYTKDLNLYQLNKQGIFPEESQPLPPEEEPVFKAYNDTVAHHTIKNP